MQMECPYCGQHYIAGSDTCDACRQPLSDEVTPPDTPTDVEESLQYETLRALKPVRPLTVSPTTSVRETVQLLATNNIGAVLVVWVDALVGIFSERDALMKIGDRMQEVAHEPIRHFMTPAPETLSADDTIAFALNRMAIGGFRHIPIEANERPASIVSVRDVLRYLTDKFPNFQK